MEKLKEYAGVIVALTTVAVALSGLVVWLVQVQVVPEIKRLDERLTSFHVAITDRLDRMDNRFDAGLVRLKEELTGRLDRMGERLDRMEKRVDARFHRIDARFDRIDARLTRVDARLTRVEGDIKNILLRLPAPEEPSAAQAPTPTAH